MRHVPNRIECHGVIGDLRSVALVALDGTIDFLCWPRFDSPSIFAGLLDPERGGVFALIPDLDGAQQRQLYLPDTNVLLTRFLSAAGVAEICDFMTVPDENGTKRLVRRVKAVRRNVRFRLHCAPRFDYGRTGHVVRAETDSVVFASERFGSLRLRATVPLRIEEDDAVAVFMIEEGDSASFILEDASEDADCASSDPRYVSRAFKETVNFWRAWIHRSQYRGRWRDVVNRSALVLKLLTCGESGAIVAAPTFGLPETPGGARNWDYRYTWLRDAAFTVYAFLRLGFTAETQAFISWLDARSCAASTDGSVPVLYALDGGDALPEVTLDHLRGYGGATPVRIGNAAAEQFQLDVYGELMDAVYLADKYGAVVSYDSWRRIVRSTDWVAANWRRPDEGIWERRDGRRELLHSRVMCWVALDRAIRLARKRGLPAPRLHWEAARDAIHADIHQNFWNAERGAFVASKGGDQLDASTLLMPLVRFISATDPRWCSTMAAIGAELMDDSLVYRYRPGETDAEMGGREGTFSMCSFWYVECLARAGDLQKARFLFEKMLGYGNHLGLFAEEIGEAGEHLGNFPQALTHLALISAAFYLDRALSAADGLA